MNKLQKIFFALAAAISLGLVGASDAMAQATCTANSVPTLVRTAGLTELTGTVVLSGCAGVIPAGGANITLTIQPSAAVITNSTAAGFIPTASVNGGAVIVGAVSGNTVTFSIPATAALATIQIGIVPGLAGSVGIRVNVNASGVVFPQQIGALLTSSPAGVLAITNNFLNVAIPQPGLTATFTAGAGIAQCAARSFATAPATAFLVPITSAATLAAIAMGTGGVTGAPAAPFAPSNAVVRVTEGFASAFLVAGAPAAGNGEGADTSPQGTRIIFRITGMPANVRAYAPQVVTGYGAANATLTLTLVAGEDGNGNGGALLVGPVAGTANLLAATTATYEVTANSTASTEQVNVPFGLFTTGTPGVGTATISAALAPLSTTGTPVVIATAPIPRFADVPISGGFTSVIGCVTNILFPYLTNTLGYDVGLTIANTTSDIFATVSQSGTCVYNFYGTNPPAGGTFTTPAFAGGVTDARLLSSMAPGFTGYAIAQCNFQLGHGFFFIVYNLGTSAGVAQGSPALIIGQPLAPLVTRQGLASAGPPFGEGLGH